MKRLLFLLICCQVAVVIAQPQPAESYRVFTYSTENGLPSNGIKGMQWDESTGFLWIATEAGISRFNGIDFVNFTRSNTSFISSERMRFLVRNRTSQIRAADMDGNVFSMSENRPVLLHNAADKKEGWINKLVGAAISDSVFLAKSIPSPNRIAFPFAKVFPVDDLSAYMMNQGGGVVYLDLRKNKITRAEQLGKEYRSGFILNGKIFLIKPESPRIYQLDFESGRALPTNFLLPSNKVTVYWESGMHHPIIMDGKSAWFLEEKSNSLVAERICSDLPNIGLIKYVQYSKEMGLLFLGTDSRGFAVVRTNRVTQVRKRNFSPQDPSAYYSQWEWKPGTVLTNEGHILGLPQSEKNPLAAKFGFSVFVDGDSLIWFSSGRPKSVGSVLFQLNQKTGKRKYYDKIDIFNVFSFARWKGRVLIGNHRGLGVLEGDSLRLVFPTNRSIIGDPVSYNLLELESGVFGMSTCAGWVRLNFNTGKADTLLRLSGYCARTQYKIGEYVLIGTYGKGFYIYHRGVLKPMPLDKNEFLLYTHCFIPDNKGFVWMSTNRGLFKASWEDLRRAFHENENRVYYHYYGKNDGMEMTELNGGCNPCGIRLASGQLSFPSMDGLVWVDPEKNEGLLPGGPIQIDELLVNGKPFENINTTAVQPNAEILIRLGYSAWANNENVYIEYRVDQGEWKEITEDRGSFIRLSNIPSGKHQLTIRKRNGFGTDNYSYRTISFSVGQAWYEKWWVYFLFIAGLITLIDAVSRFRNRQLLARQALLESMVNEKTQALKEQNEVLEKNNNIKTRLISIISHDIVTPLKFLTVAGKSLKENRKKLSEEVQQETIADITQTAQELQLLSTNILNWIKYQNENRLLLPEIVSPHSLTEQVFGLMATTAKEKNIQLVNSVDPNWKIEQFSEPLKILIYNLVSNSLRYSDGGVVTVGATVKNEGESMLWVSDSGIGMKPETIEHLLTDEVLVHNKSNESRSGHGLGYLIIKDLVRWMGGRIEIQSQPGSGTKVSIFIRPRPKSKPAPL